MRGFAIAALIAAPAAAQQAVGPAVAAGETLLQVEAMGTASAVPDLATISATVTSDAADARAALSSNSIAANRVVDALRAAGVPDDQIRTDDLRVVRRFRKDKGGDDTDEVIGARATDRIKVRLTRVGDAGRVIEALVRAGATELTGPEFGFQDDGEIRRRARAAAVRRAQAQASDYAAAFGLHAGRILRISERALRGGEGQDIVVTGSRVGVPAPNVQPGEQEVTVTLWVDYALTR